MAQGGARVPKFGGWGGGDNAPNYTVYFGKAREDRAGGKMINPNDPQANPNMFSNTKTEPGPAAAAGDKYSPHHRHGGGGGGGSGGRTTRHGGGTGSADNSVERSPRHSQQGKNSSHGGGGAAANSRLNPANNQGDDTPDRGAAVPKFGDWNEKDPEAAKNFTGIFQRVRDERYNGPGKSPGREGPQSFPTTPRKPNPGDSAKCSCFPWGRK